ncbi:GntR family transcriptional regulator [Rhodococcus pyridinivorans]|uniref:GntR family transcriptional regulator n=1 Tax=Rhodococcus pyridinivorans TaxID=103816 RepID=UPI0009C0BEC8|nr:GntR family transcriptional regulator [Rhodococcus pyridinivorans]
MTNNSRHSSALPTALPPVVPGSSVPRLEHRVTTSLLVDQVFDALRSRIARGEWAPGTLLRIREIATLLGTSEMPVREAFRRLTQAGLLKAAPYKGATVRVLSIDELEHVYDVRLMLEPQAGRLGAMNANEAAIAAMRHHRQLLEDAADRGDVVEAVAQDEHFLTALYEASGNHLLVNTIRGLWDTCRPYKNLWVTNAIERGMATWTHLSPLLEAAEQHDATAAFAVLEQTYQDARAVVRQLLDTRSDEHQ